MKNVRQPKGLPIMNWIYSGPFTLNVSDVYSSNYHVPIEPYLPFINEGKDKIEAKKSFPFEGKSMELFGQHEKWKYLRINETDKKVTWAKFGLAQLMLTYLYNQITVKKSGKYKFNLWVQGSSSIYIGDVLVFENLSVGRVDGCYCFEAQLQEGINHCTIMLSNVHVHCMNSFKLSIDNSDCEISLPLATENFQFRQSIEEDFDKFYLTEDLIKMKEPIILQIDKELSNVGEYVFTISKKVSKIVLGDEVIWQKNIQIEKHDVKEVFLCHSDELDGSDLIISIDYIDNKGNYIYGSSFSLCVVDYFDKLTKGDFNERKAYLLDIYSDLQRVEVINKSYHQLARLEASKDELFDEQAVEETIDFINSRYDCSDFALHGLLRLYYKYQHSNKLSDKLKAKIKQCILDFKYWEDEPGKSMMFTRSENHEILFYTAEYLAGLLFPIDVFTNSNQNGLFHVLKGRLNAERWIKEKGTYGFMEWHSNCYFEEDLITLVNVFDFGEENAYIRILAKNLLDLICFIIATHNYNGILATTHGRSYERMIIYPQREPISHLNWLLYGNPKVLSKHLSIGAVALTTSKYQPPKEFEGLANSKSVIFTLSRMGLFPHKGLGGVNCATYRTKDYMVSGMVESNMGEHGHQVHAGQVLMNGNIPIFATCFDNNSETTRPSYWGGQYRIPKTIAYKNILAYIYQIDDIIGYTHCYFPIKSFDKTIQKDKRIFGCKGDAYIALYSLKPYKIIKEGKYKDRELLCYEKKNIWLIEMGNKAKWDSFDKFVESILNAKITQCDENITFESPSNGLIELGWNVTCKINGAAVLEGNYPLIQNDFAFSEYGSGIINLEVGDTKRILNFNI